jgi:hypothetical protein
VAYWIERQTHLLQDAKTQRESRPEHGGTGPRLGEVQSDRHELGELTPREVQAAQEAAAAAEEHEAKAADARAPSE